MGFKISPLSSKLLLILLNPLWIAILTAAAAVAAPLDNSTAGPGEGSDFDFDKIPPSQNLDIWYRCYDDFWCAKLLVPLDYHSNEPLSSGNASIALIKLPPDPSYSNDEYSTSWSGPLLVNPGGPGGSGVSFVVGAGKALQQIAGRGFSIIGFDPRGVRNSRPRFTCFDDPVDRKLWAFKNMGRLGSTASGEEVAEHLSLNKAYGKLCTTGERGEQAKYVGTASVARDMLAINDAIMESARKATGLNRKWGLQYWGLSYGTALGVTFAKMFPDRVMRMVLDGVLDVNDWFGRLQVKNLLDMETVMSTFYTYCHIAGPLQCPFYTGTNPDHIRQRLQTLFTSLRKQPLAYLAKDQFTKKITEQPAIFTYNELKLVIFPALYDPVPNFQPLSQFFTLIEKALPTGFFPEDSETPMPALSCSATEGEDPLNEGLMDIEVRNAVMCGDMGSLRNMTLPEFRGYLNKLRSQSPIGGDNWATLISACVGWAVQAAEKPPMEKFVAPAKNETLGQNQILFVGNTADPATPLVNAYSMAKLFPKNATAVAVQEGEGHCSLASPSECMMSLIRQYFRTGSVPDGIRCAQEVRPFGIGNNSTSTQKRDTNNEPSDIEAAQTIKEALKKNWLSTHVMA